MKKISLVCYWCLVLMQFFWEWPVILQMPHFLPSFSTTSISVLMRVIAGRPFFALRMAESGTTFEST